MLHAPHDSYKKPNHERMLHMTKIAIILLVAMMTCAIAVNVVDERNICMIAGTWSINEYLRREPVLDGKVMMNSLFALPEYYLVEE